MQASRSHIQLGEFFARYTSVFLRCIGASVLSSRIRGYADGRLIENAQSLMRNINETMGGWSSSCAASRGRKVKSGKLKVEISCKMENGKGQKCTSRKYVANLFNE